MSTPDVTFVLGMHRSGTSLVARLINLMGIELGAAERPAPSARDNPRGYWEHPALTPLNDESLATLGGRWDAPPPLRAGWEADPKLEPLRSVAQSRLESEFEGMPSWGWKDPRTSLTLPFWRNLVAPSRYILCLRNPMDVASSLERRDGFSLGKSQGLWLRYVADALSYTAGQPRLLVFYEDLLEDRSVELERLIDFLGVRPDGKPRLSGPELGSFIEDTLRHHRASLGEVMDNHQIVFPVRALYAALRAYGVRGKAEVLEALGRCALDASAAAQS